MNPTANLPVKTMSHLLLDLHNVPDLSMLETVEALEALVEALVYRFPLTVVGRAAHQFQPIGATVVYLLAESHLSIHTWPEEGRLCFDLFCCAPRFDLTEVVGFVVDWYGGRAQATWQIVPRTGRGPG
jgi:S-adenosylmethionine decarboxylase